MPFIYLLSLSKKVLNGSFVLFIFSIIGMVYIINLVNITGGPVNFAPILIK